MRALLLLMLILYTKRYYLYLAISLMPIVLQIYGLVGNMMACEVLCLPYSVWVSAMTSVLKCS